MSKTTLNLGSFGLTDGNADKILFFDDSAGAIGQLAASTNLTLSGTNLTASGGKILQVVGATDNTQKDTSSTSYADTGLSASITPSSTSSKILVLSTINTGSSDNSNGAHIGRFTMTIGSTTTAEFRGDAAGSRKRNSSGRGNESQGSATILTNGFNFV